MGGQGQSQSRTHKATGPAWSVPLPVMALEQRDPCDGEERPGPGRKPGPEHPSPQLPQTPLGWGCGQNRRKHSCGLEIHLGGCLKMADLGLASPTLLAAGPRGTQVSGQSCGRAFQGAVLPPASGLHCCLHPTWGSSITRSLTHPLTHPLTHSRPRLPSLSAPGGQTPDTMKGFR